MVNTVADNYALGNPMTYGRQTKGYRVGGAKFFPWTQACHLSLVFITKKVSYRARV